MPLLRPAPLRMVCLYALISSAPAWADPASPVNDPPISNTPQDGKIAYENAQFEQAAINNGILHTVGRRTDAAAVQNFTNLDSLGLTPGQLQVFQERLGPLATDVSDPDRMKLVGKKLDAMAIQLGPGGDIIVKRFFAENLRPFMASLAPSQTNAPVTATPKTAVPENVLTALAQGGPTAKGIASELYANSGQHDKAVALASLAVKGGNTDPGVLLIRGQSAEKLHDFQLANADARRVLAQQPDNKLAHSLYMLTRDRPSSVHLLDAGGLVGTDGRLMAGIEGARPGWDGSESGANPSALTAAQISAQENAAFNTRPANALSAKLTEDAKRALTVGDFVAALRLTEEALRADPRNATALYMRATAFLQSGDNASAAQAASAGLALAPGNAPLLYTRAVAYGRQKAWESAYKDADDAVRNASRAGYGYQARAAVNWGLKRREAMLEDLRAAARLDPRYRADLQRAVQQPEDIDPTLLFGGAPVSTAAPAAAASSRVGRYALWGVGAVLAVLGLLPILFPSVRRQVTTVFRRGPAVEHAEASAAAIEQEAPPGFWRRYEVVREIGAGGMGIVYEAWDKNLQRRVAVKRMRDEIRADRRERERFLQEARTVAQMRHPNLVEIYSIEEDGDDAYLVFEFVEGKTLYELIAEKAPLSPVDTVDLFRGLSAGVDYAHRRGVIHRDLKPANVIVQPDGTVKIMDFGVARQAQDALVRQDLTNTVIGTPPYMAPEQEQGIVCAQSDIYALGVCLYQALSGVLPFQGTAGAVLLAKMAARYEPLERRLPNLPPSLARVIDRALDPKPETRIQSAAELQKELEAAIQPSRAL